MGASCGGSVARSPLRRRGACTSHASLRGAARRVPPLLPGRRVVHRGADGHGARDREGVPRDAAGRDRGAAGELGARSPRGCLLGDGQGPPPTRRSRPSGTRGSSSCIRGGTTASTTGTSLDLVAYQVFGTWLLERPRDVLHELAGSDSGPERHTAIVATRRLPRPRAGPRHPRHQPSPRGRRPSVGAEGRRLDAVFAQPKSRPIDKKTDYDDWTRLPRSAGVRLHTAGTRPPRCC
jgi:hypothetical protein